LQILEAGEKARHFQNIKGKIYAPHNILPEFPEIFSPTEYTGI